MWEFSGLISRPLRFQYTPIICLQSRQTCLKTTLCNEWQFKSWHALLFCNFSFNHSLFESYLVLQNGHQFQAVVFGKELVGLASNLLEMSPKISFCNIECCHQPTFGICCTVSVWLFCFKVLHRYNISLLGDHMARSWSGCQRIQKIILESPRRLFAR